MRLTNAMKEQYQRLESPHGDGTCYYCGAPGIMDDTTPSHRVSPSVKTAFAEPWTIVKVCNSCWHKIHTANIVNGGVRFGVQAGLMTMEHKRIVVIPQGHHSGIEIPFVFLRNERYMAPSGYMMSETDGTFLIDGTKFDRDEMDMLQPIMLLKTNGYDRRIYMDIYRKLLDDPEEKLNPARDEIYRRILRESVVVRKEEGDQPW